MDADPVAPRVRFRMEGAALNWATLALLVVIWGSAFAALRVAVSTIDPLWTIAGRMASAATLLALIVGGRRLRRRRDAMASERITLQQILVYGLIGIAFTATPFMLYAIAARTTQSADLAICNGATPFVTMIAARALIGDRMTAGRMAGVVLGFCGLVLLVWPEASKAASDPDTAAWGVSGVLLAIVGAALYAGGNVTTRMAPLLSPLLSSCIIVGAGAVAALIAAIVFAPVPTSASPASIAAVLYLGLLPTGFAMILYVWLIQRAGPVFVSFSTYLTPLWATLLGVTLMGEVLNAWMIGALALILTGVAIANPLRSRRSIATD